MSQARMSAAILERATIRIGIVLSLSASLAACDPMPIAAIQVAPRAATNPDSTTERAFASVARIASEYGLRPSELARNENSGWIQCFTRGTLFLCGKLHSGEAQFQLRQFQHFSKDSQIFMRELLDSLQHQFGPEQVRECKWQNEDSLERTGCVPMRAAAAPGH